ncbi:DNA repair protein RadC [Tahibacter aquaticus]|uniref:DNA repair protein RadC n=1 Tax=Tahibacter aquaticus TaxID=520092 RepID=A0A4R6YM45_9GAMM|nr:DNA repair protein RadC [Tahibacter aquaticus]TDR38422.1 DNA repair protein RadC [Tahibacter aquaticus]
MNFIHRSDGTYRFHRSRTDVAECDVLAAAEDILRRRLERHGSVSKPTDAISFLRARIGHLPHEEFHVLWLDTRHRIIAAERLFAGTLDGTAVHAREVVRRALEVNASAVVLAHNHPSGVAEPSHADRLITRELSSALGLIGVRVLDHVIVSAGASVSLAELGELAN